MFDATAKALFPLPLAAFEKYMFLDDRPDYPMVFALQLLLTGRPDRAAFHAAFEEALARHPLLCALVGRSRRRGLVWNLAEHRRPEIDWNCFDVPLAHPRGERIDLHDEVGLRCWVREGDGSAQLTLQFHHATCDGLGALQFLADLLATYGRRTAPRDQRPASPDCDPSRTDESMTVGMSPLTPRKATLVSSPIPSLSRREQHPPAAISPPEDLRRSLWTDLRDVGRLLLRRPAVLGPSGVESDSHAEPIPFLGMFSHQLDLRESLRLREAADRQKVTVNDLLVHEMFLGLQTWLAGQSPAASSRWIRLAVPVSLRTGDGDCSSACNQVSYNLLTRDRHLCDGSGELLQSLSRENHPYLRRRRGLMFLRGIRCFSRIPGGMRLYLSRRRCLATVVLSNVGDIQRNIGAMLSRAPGKLTAGNLVLESFVCAPPVRPNTAAAFMVHKYDGRYGISLRCDPRLFSAPAARLLLALYVERLKRIL